MWHLIKNWCWFRFFRRLKGGTIEPHPSENALIINYTLEATVFNEPGDAMLEKSKVYILCVFSRHIYFWPSMTFSSVCFHWCELDPLVHWVACVNLQWSYIHIQYESTRTLASMQWYWLLSAKIGRLSSSCDSSQDECKCFLSIFLRCTQHSSYTNSTVQ